MDWLSVAAAADAGGTIPQDYIAYWSFDTDASDATGNYSATATNNTPTFVSSGGVGNRGYVSCDSNPSWDSFTIPSLNRATGDPLTIALWVNYNGFSLSQYIFGDRASTHRAFFVNSAGTLYFSTSQPPGSDTTTSFGIAAYPTGWHHYIFVLDDGTNGATYVDGELATGGVSIAYYSQSFDLLLKHYGNIGFRGFADEIYVWDRILSSNEVNNIYNAEQP